MVLPDSYEPEKFERPEEETQVASECEVQDVIKVQRKTLTKDELHKQRYDRMFKEIDQLKEQTREMESYRQVIEAVHRRTITVPRKKKFLSNSNDAGSQKEMQTQESELSIASICSKDKAARNRMSMRKSEMAVPKLNNTLGSKNNNVQVFSINLTSELPQMIGAHSISPENS